MVTKTARAASNAAYIDQQQRAANELSTLDVMIRNTPPGARQLELYEQQNAVRVRYQVIGARLNPAATPPPADAGVEWRRAGLVSAWILGEAASPHLKAGAQRRLQGSTLSTDEFLAQLPPAPKGLKWDCVLASGRAVKPNWPINYQGDVVATLVKAKWSA